MSVKNETKMSGEELLSLDWISIYNDKVLIDDEIEAKRLKIDHIGAAAILAITDDECVVLVEQFRYPTGQALYEIPAGKLDEFGGDFYETAMRELAEETPFTATSLDLISAFYIAPGYSNEFMHIYQANGLKKNSELSLDQDEFIDIHYFTKNEIKKMLKNGEILDAKTIIALQYWLFGKNNE